MNNAGFQSDGHKYFFDLTSLSNYALSLQSMLVRIVRYLMACLSSVSCQLEDPLVNFEFLMYTNEFQLFTEINHHKQISDYHI